MDGFHLDNDTLSGMNLLERKGAPETFDAEGFVDLVERIAANRDTVSVPGFDRSTDAVVPDIDVVEPHHKAIVLEGNYLLLQSAPWNRISGLLDLSILINPGQEELERRLIQRWLDQGFSLDKAVRKARSNDIPNAFTVIENSSKADIVITSDC
jgi:pantothenate kinase